MNYPTRATQLVPALLVLMFAWLSAHSPLMGQQWPKQMFEEYVHDFQQVKLGDVPVYKFEITNPFKETVHIQSVTSSCGCTIATPTKRTLKTWEKGEIVCKFNTPAVGTGFKQATVTVRFDQPMLGEAQLTVRGTIVGGVTVKPESIEFGQVTDTDLDQAIQRIQLTAGGNPYFRIRDVKSTFEHIRVQLFEKGRTNEMVTYEILAQLTDSVAKGFSQGELYLVVETGRNPDGSVALQQVPVKFSAKVVSALQVSPQVLSIGPVTPGESTSQKIFLKSDKPFSVRDVRCRSEAFRVKAGNGTKKLHIVEVTYTATAAPGQHECELTFFVEYPDATNNRTTAGSESMKAIIEIAEPETGDAKAELPATENSELAGSEAG